MSIVMPRRFSSSRRSASMPVRAFTSAVLPWSIWPAVPTIMFFMAPALIVLLGCAGLAQSGAGLVQQSPQSQPGTPKPTATPPAANAQQTTPTEGPLFRAGVSLVKVDVQVVDRNGRGISGLTKDDFRVYDDGRPQKMV